MTHWLRRGALGFSVAAVLALAVTPGPHEVSPPVWQDGGAGGIAEQQDIRLPNGKMQKDEILKAEHQQNIKDAAQLAATDLAAHSSSLQEPSQTPAILIHAAA